MTAHYKPETYNLAKQLYVEEGKTTREICAHLGGKPAAATIGRWAIKTDRSGKTWNDYRDEYRNRSYEQLSTQDMVARIFKEIRNALAAEKVDADQLVKLTKALERLAEPRHHIHIMFRMLTDFLTFLRSEYPALATGETGDQIGRAVLDFKNQLRNDLERG